MRYMLIIAGDEAALAALSPEEGKALVDSYVAFAMDATASGVLQTIERVRPSTEATTVRVRNGKVETSDGPLVEAKEQIAGYAMIDCKDLDQALEIAAKVPAALTGSVEVRPIWEMQ
jgi:hypothetical protein